MKKKMKDSITTSRTRAMVEAARDTFGPDFSSEYANLKYEIRQLTMGPQRPIVAHIIALKKQMMEALKKGEPIAEIEAEARYVERVYRLAISKKRRCELFQKLAEKFAKQAVYKSLAGDLDGAKIAERLHIYYENDGDWEFADISVDVSDLIYVIALHTVQSGDYDVIAKFRQVASIPLDDIMAALEDVRDLLR